MIAPWCVSYLTVSHHNHTDDNDVDAGTQRLIMVYFIYLRQSERESMINSTFSQRQRGQKSIYSDTSDHDSSQSYLYTNTTLLNDIQYVL